MHTHISAAVAVSSLLVFSVSVSAEDMQTPWSLQASTADVSWQDGHNFTCNMDSGSDLHGNFDDAWYTHALHGTIQSRTYYLAYISDDAAYLNFETYYDTANTQAGTSPEIHWVFSGSFYMPADHGTFYIAVKPGIDLRGADRVKIKSVTDGTDHGTTCFTRNSEDCRTPDQVIDLPNPDTKLVELNGVAGQTVDFTITLGVEGQTSGEVPNETPIVTAYIGYGDVPHCEGDLDKNGVVDPTDLALVLGGWGTNDPDIDINGDGVVGPEDLSLLLGAWGVCP